MTIAQSIARLNASTPLAIPHMLVQNANALGFDRNLGNALARVCRHVAGGTDPNTLLWMKRWRDAYGCDTSLFYRINNNDWQSPAAFKQFKLAAERWRASGLEAHSVVLHLEATSADADSWPWYIACREYFPAAKIVAYGHPAVTPTDLATEAKHVWVGSFDCASCDAYYQASALNRMTIAENQRLHLSREWVVFYQILGYVHDHPDGSWHMNRDARRTQSELVNNARMMARQNVAAYFLWPTPVPNEVEDFAAAMAVHAEAFR